LLTKAAEAETGGEKKNTENGTSQSELEEQNAGLRDKVMKHYNACSKARSIKVTLNNTWQQFSYSAKVYSPRTQLNVKIPFAF